MSVIRWWWGVATCKRGGVFRVDGLSDILIQCALLDYVPWTTYSSCFVFLIIVHYPGPLLYSIPKSFSIPVYYSLISFCSTFFLVPVPFPFRWCPFLRTIALQFTLSLCNFTLFYLYHIILVYRGPRYAISMYRILFSHHVGSLISHNQSVPDLIPALDQRLKVLNLACILPVDCRRVISKFVSRHTDNIVNSSSTQFLFIFFTWQKFFPSFSFVPSRVMTLKSDGRWNEYKRISDMSHAPSQELSATLTANEVRVPCAAFLNDQSVVTLHNALHVADGTR